MRRSPAILPAIPLAILLAAAVFAPASLPAASAIAAGPEAAAGATATADVVVEERRVHYVVDAADVAGMRRQLDERGPSNRFGHPASALTRHNIVVQYVLWRSSGRCELQDVQVRTSIDIHLPRWEPRRTPPEALVEQWRRLERALTEHESGHRDNGVWASHELSRRLRALPAMEDCRALEREAWRSRRALVAELRDREDDYDRRTDFSRAQVAPKVEAEARNAGERDAERDRARARRLINGQ